MRAHVLRVELEQFLKLHQSVVQFPALQVDNGEIVSGRGKRGSDFNRLGEVELLLVGVLLRGSDQGFALAEILKRPGIDWGLGR